MEKRIEEKGTMEKDKPKTKKTVKSKKQVQEQVFKDVEGKFLFVRVGTSKDPAADADITEVRDQLLELFEKNNVNCLTYVTHHAVSIDVIGNNNGGV